MATTVVGLATASLAKDQARIPYGERLQQTQTDDAAPVDRPQSTRPTVPNGNSRGEPNRPRLNMDTTASIAGTRRP